MQSKDDKTKRQEQKLFVLLFIHHYESVVEDEEVKAEKKPNKETLLKYIPVIDTPLQIIDRDYLEQILGELIDGDYVKSDDAGSYYQLSDAGREHLRENDLLIESDGGSILERYLPREGLQNLLNALADNLNAQISIMDESGNFHIYSEPEMGICAKTAIRNRASRVSCICCDMLAARRARSGADCYRCHAGSAECIAPIRLDGRICGYIFMGRILPNNLDVDKFIGYCKAIGARPPNKTKLLAQVVEGATEDGLVVMKNITDGIATLLSAIVRGLDDYATKIEILDEIIEVDAGVPDLDDILSRIIESAHKIFAFDDVVIWRLDIDQRTLFPLVPHKGLSQLDEELQFDLGEESLPSWIARKRKPLFIDDIVTHIESGKKPQPKYEDYLKYVKKEDLHSYLGVPLIVEGRFIGVLEITKRGVGQFTDMDQKLLMAIAHIAGIAIDKSRLLDVLTDISEQDNLSALLQTAVREMPALLGALYCSVFLFDPEKKKLFLRASSGPGLKDQVNKAYYDAGENTGTTWYVAETGKTIRMTDVRKAPRWAGRYWEAAEARGDFGYLGYPLKDRRGAVRGVIRFINKEQRPFMEYDERLAGILATWLSTAIDWMQLDIARRHSELLLRIAEIQNTSSSIEELLDRVAEEMARAFDCEICEIALVVDGNHYKLVVQGVYGAETKGISYPKGDDSFTMAVALEREIINLRDIRDFYQTRPVPDKLPLGSRLGIPLVQGGELIGVLKLANKYP
ncbi:GAF domain-containing protein [Candidatus Poribacteria bacterium]